MKLQNAKTLPKMYIAISVFISHYHSELKSIKVLIT